MLCLLKDLKAMTKTVAIIIPSTQIIILIYFLLKENQGFLGKNSESKSGIGSIEDELRTSCHCRFQQNYDRLSKRFCQMALGDNLDQFPPSQR